jgi:N-methylhydantoinase A/oxoprolinase/acetone carboxylase beta subunit
MTLRVGIDVGGTFTDVTASMRISASSSPFASTSPIRRSRPP